MDKFNDEKHVEEDAATTEVGVGLRWEFNYEPPIDQ